MSETSLQAPARQHGHSENLPVVLGWGCVMTASISLLISGASFGIALVEAIAGWADGLRLWNMGAVFWVPTAFGILDTTARVFLAILGVSLIRRRSVNPRVAITWGALTLLLGIGNLIQRAFDMREWMQGHSEMDGIMLVMRGIGWAERPLIGVAIGGIVLWHFWWRDARCRDRIQCEVATR